MTRKKAVLAIIVSVVAILVSCYIFYKWSRIFVHKSGQKSVRDFEKLIEEISEMIIPATETPGARDAKVAGYIISVMENCTSDKEQNAFASGLESLQIYSLKNFSNYFEGCNLEDKTAILKYFENKGSFSNPLLNKVKIKILGESFFEQMRRLVTTGYCTSRLGATQGLVYDHIPIDYLACTPYQHRQRSWATK